MAGIQMLDINNINIRRHIAIMSLISLWKKVTVNCNNTSKLYCWYVFVLGSINRVTATEKTLPTKGS